MPYPRHAPGNRKIDIAFDTYRDKIIGELEDKFEEMFRAYPDWMKETALHAIIGCTTPHELKRNTDLFDEYIIDLAEEAAEYTGPDRLEEY